MEPTKYVDVDGRVTYKLNGVLHRLDGPAIEYPDGTKAWLVNGKWHRLDGPAIECPNGDKSWYINDTRYVTEFEYWFAVQTHIDTHQTA